MLFSLGSISSGATALSGTVVDPKATGEGYAFFSSTNGLSSGTVQVIGRYDTTDDWTVLATLSATVQTVKVPLMPLMSIYGIAPNQNITVKLKVLRTSR